jgi:hypothetical protein
MELRFSSDYAQYINQTVIRNYLKTFINNVRQRADETDLDYTDYEVLCLSPICFSFSMLLLSLFQKTVFNETFHQFIEHYRQRVQNDPRLFLPTRENLVYVQNMFECVFQTKII